jgi:hypothetical protein
MIKESKGIIMLRHLVMLKPGLTDREYAHLLHMYAGAGAINSRALVLQEMGHFVKSVWYGNLPKDFAITELGREADAKYIWTSKHDWSDDTRYWRYAPLDPEEAVIPVRRR